LAERKADLVAFGRPFIANPDFVERMKTGAPLADFNPAALHGQGAAGYTDYPTIAMASQ
jgi:N-ethylmaleimide reductase